MRRNSHRSLIAGGVIALVVAGSWAVAYRLGARSGQDLAGEVTGVVIEPAAEPPSPTSPSAPGSAPVASVGTRPPVRMLLDAASAASPDPAQPAKEAQPSQQALDQFLDTLSLQAGRALLSLRLHQAANQLGLADIPVAIDGLAALPPGPKRDEALLAVVARWARMAPEEAMAYAEDEAIPGLRERMIDATFSGWAMSNPTAALTYLEQHPDWALAETAGDALFEAVAQRPAAEAFMFLEQIDAEQHGREIHRTLSRMLDLDPLAVHAWAQGLPEGPLRESAIARSVSAWALYQPEAARDWTMENLEGDQLSAQLPRLAGAWARNDPEAARNWYLELSADLQSPRIGEEVFESWLEEDWDAASAYLNEAAPQVELDQGFKEYAYRVQRHDPSQAMDLTSRIIDDDTRTSTQSRIARYWAQRNPRATLGYLESSTIPVEEQAPLIRYAESRLKQQTQRNRR